MKWNLTLACIFAMTLAHAQTLKDKISHTLEFEKKSPANTLIVSNINGSITVIGYDGDRVLVDAERTINGKTDTRLEKGKIEVQVNTINQVDTLVVYVKDGCNSFSLDRGDGNRNDDRWGYNWNCGNNCNIEYNYTVHITVKVPSSINVVANTINEGDVLVEGVSGAVKANNINGSIKLNRIKREVYASTINGDVTIDYSSNPPGECRFYSLNGDINANFKKGLAANMSFESFNGSFYTNINGIEPLPAKLEKTEEKDGVKFKVNGNQYRIGAGGALLDFETFNGDVYLKEIE